MGLKNENLGMMNEISLPSAARVSTAICLILYGATHPVIAAAEEANDSALDEVIVTATRREERLENVPYAISVLGPTQLANSGVTDIAALATQVPGLSMNQFGARDSEQIRPTIRGINLTTPDPIITLRSAEQSPVGLYIGNSPIQGYIQFDDVERIEVLRGPQGTAYGAGALGGTIRIIPKTPDLSGVSGSIDLAGGSIARSRDASRGASAMLNLPLSDTLALRVSGKYAMDPGFIDLYGVYQRDAETLYAQPVLANPSSPATSSAIYTSRKDWNDQKSATGRISILWKPNEVFNAQAAFMYGDVRGHGLPAANPDFAGGASPIDPQVNLRASDQYSFISPIDQPFNHHQSFGTLDLNYDLGFATLSTTSTYADGAGDTLSDQTFIIASIPFYAAYYSGQPFNPRFLALSEFKDNSHSFAQEVRLVSNAGESKRVDYTVGLYYQNQVSRGIWDIATPGATSYAQAAGCTGYYAAFSAFPDCLPRLGPGDLADHIDDVQRFRDFSQFGELTWHISAKADVTVGVRHFQQKFDDAQITDTYPTFAVDQHILETSSSPASKTVWKVNPSYKYLPGHRIYAEWSQGFRRGGTTSLLTQGPLAENPLLTTYKPDTTNNYEIGFKGHLASGPRYTLSVFYVKWKDPQVVGTLPSAARAVWNAPEAESKGVELELSAPLGASGLSLAFGGSYVDAKLTQSYDIQADIFGDVYGNAGQRLPGSPKITAATTLTYDRNIGDGYKLSMSLNDVYRSDMLLSTYPLEGTSTIPNIPGMNLVNFSSAVARGPWRLGLYVTNLADKRANQAMPTRLNQLSNLTNTWVINQPRKIELRAGYSFGGK